MMKQAGRRLGHVKQLVGTGGGGQSISEDKAALLVVEDVVDGEREGRREVETTPLPEGEGE